WVDKKEKATHIPAKGKPIESYTEGKRDTTEITAFKSGIGDRDDLLVKKPDHEALDTSFKYAARFRGKKKHETDVYPEIPFQYGIHYEGKELVTDNEQEYSHRVDAYPGKTIQYSVTQEDPQPLVRNWEAQLNIDARVK